MTERADVAVIGAGLLGLAAARELTRRGRDVVVVDQAEPGHAGSGSKGSCRIFRLGYDDAEYVRLARRARELWTELEAATGTTLLHPTPQLTFGPDMAAVADAMRHAGARHEVISAAQAADRFPGVAATGQVLVEPDSAVIAADRVIATLASGMPRPVAAARATELADDGRRVRVSTSAGPIDAARVIVCAGPWTAGLLATAGIIIPGTATAEQVGYLAPAGAADRPGQTPSATAAAAPHSTSAASATPIMVHYGGEFPYGLPVPGSPLYKFGLHHCGRIVDPDHQDMSADAELTQRIERAARRYLPGLNPRPVTLERCVYDNTPDEHFIIDRVGNVVIGSGTSGHGFKFGPLFGAWLANLADGSESDPPPHRFSASRF